MELRKESDIAPKSPTSGVVVLRFEPRAIWLQGSECIITILTWQSRGSSAPLGKAYIDIEPLQYGCETHQLKGDLEI